MDLDRLPRHKFASPLLHCDSKLQPSCVFDLRSTRMTVRARVFTNGQTSFCFSPKRWLFHDARRLALCAWLRSAFFGLWGKMMPGVHRQCRDMRFTRFERNRLVISSGDKTLLGPKSERQLSEAIGSKLSGTIIPWS